MFESKPFPFERYLTVEEMLPLLPKGVEEGAIPKLTDSFLIEEDGILYMNTRIL